MKTFGIKTGGKAVAGNLTGGTKNSRATVQSTVQGGKPLQSSFPVNADTQLVSPGFHYTAVTPGKAQPIGLAQPLNMNSPVVDTLGLHKLNYTVASPARTVKRPNGR